MVSLHFTLDYGDREQEVRVWVGKADKFSVIANAITNEWKCLGVKLSTDFVLSSPCFIKTSITGC